MAVLVGSSLLEEDEENGGGGEGGGVGGRSGGECAGGLGSGPSISAGMGGELPCSDDTAKPLPWYGDGAAYWDMRYKYTSLDDFDWLEEYAQIRELVARSARAEAGGEPRILHVGCGNSRLPRQMYEDGFNNILNVDVSEVVVERMAVRHADCAGMQWRVLDVTDMPDVPSGGFDLVLDKGMFDTVAAAKDSLVEDRRREAILLVARYLKEVSRVLRPGGVFLCISHSPPAAREPFFSLPCLSFAVAAQELPLVGGTPDPGDLEALDGVDDPNFAYICTRMEGADAALELWREVALKLTPAPAAPTLSAFPLPNNVPSGAPAPVCLE